MRYKIETMDYSIEMGFCDHDCDSYVEREYIIQPMKVDQTFLELGPYKYTKIFLISTLGIVSWEFLARLYNRRFTPTNIFFNILKFFAK